MTEETEGAMRRLGTAAVLTAMSMMLPVAGSAQTMAPREAPAKTLPVPTTVSPELQAIIAQPLRAGWDTPPTTKEGWAALVKQLEADGRGRDAADGGPAACLDPAVHN